MSVDSLWRNKRRALLTMLGIVIGVGSVIVMLAIGQAAERFILSQVASFGSDLLFIRNGPGDGKQASGPPTTAVKQTLTEHDYEALQRQSWIRAVGANVYSQLLVESPTKSLRVQIAGSAESEVVIYNVEIESGEFIGAEDVTGKARIAVLGHDLAHDFFGEEDPLGKTVKIGKKSYRVIGVLKPAGTRFFTNLDRQIYVPFSSLMEQLNIERLQFISVKIGDVSASEAQERIRGILRDKHRLDNPEADLAKDDFFVATQEDTARRAGTIGTILQVLLSSVAAISLLVGGVGIMNIMYVTVTERTREIGLRKAIGAQSQDVLRQFLAEAIFLTVVAGVIGILSGVTLSFVGLQVLAVYQDGWSFAMPWNGIGLGFGVSVLIGIVFGYFPARRAAQLHPIEALRYE